MLIEKRHKIFQIGFNKCGTRSLAHLFRQHGYRVAHWERGDLGFALRHDIEAGRKPLGSWTDFDAFFDMEAVTHDTMIEGRKWFEPLHRAYPDAVFIMNHRDFDDWADSRFHHDDGQYIQAFKHHFHLQSDEELRDLWAHDWGAHMRDVHHYFSDQPQARFVSFHIDTPDFEALQRACGHPIDRAHWTSIGKTKP